MELSAGLQVQTIASDLWRGVGVRGGTVDGWRGGGWSRKMDGMSVQQTGSWGLGAAMFAHVLARSHCGWGQIDHPKG